MTPTPGRDVWNERYRSTESVWGGAPNRFVAEVFTGREPGRALDLGCGEGRNALWLAGIGWQLTAVDFADVAIERGRLAANAAGLDVTWIAQDLLDYRPEPANFDAALIVYLHLPPAGLAVVLDRAVAALAPNGLLAIIGHDRRNLTEGVGGPQDPSILYTVDELTNRMRDLSLDRAERVLRQVDGAPRPAIDTLIVARKPAHPQDSSAK